MGGGGSVASCSRAGQDVRGSSLSDPDRLARMKRSLTITTTRWDLLEKKTVSLKDFILN